MAVWIQTLGALISFDAEARENQLEGFEIGDQVGNPLYSVINEHVAAVVLLALMPAIGWLIVRLLRRWAARGHTPSLAILDGYQALPVARRWAVWAIVSSAVVHAALVFTHEPSAFTALYATGAGLLVLAAVWVVHDRRSRLTALILVSSVVGFWFLGAPPDQLGIVTKLIEMFALALLVVPGAGVRRRFGPAGVATLVVLTGVAAWAGAFNSAGEDGGHHGGEYPDLATVVPYIERLEPTVEERRAADELYQQIVVAVEKYQDPSVAEADGYDVGTIIGTDHHADNPAYIADGRILDPGRPETLVYAQGNDGPVLIGAMFQMPGFHNPGPMIGGPLTVWHSHENVCISVTPPALVGLMSPFGVCPVGSFNMPGTNEAIHVWTLPGVEDEWGHLEDAWLEDYLSRH